MKSFLQVPIITLAFLNLSIQEGYCQNLSVSETIDYINNAFLNSRSKYFRYKILSASNDNISIERHKLASWENKYEQITFNPNEISVSKIYFTNKMEMCDGTKYNTGGDNLIIYCKNNSNCIYDSGTNEYRCNIPLYLEISTYDYEKVANSFKYLISTLQKQNTSKEPDKDPFAPSNFNKTNPSNVKPLPNTNPCNTKKVTRQDGTTIRYLNPELVGKGQNCELGLSFQTNGVNYFLASTVRYISTARKIIGSLKIQLSNGQALELNLYTSEIAVMQNEQVGLSVFYLTDADINKLLNSKLKTIIFQEYNGLYQIINLNQNFDIAQRHLNCLSK
jgi:hypothetical protein